MCVCHIQTLPRATAQRPRSSARSTNCPHNLSPHSPLYMTLSSTHDHNSSITSSHSHTISPLLCPLTLSPSHSVTLSLCHPLTLSSSHSIILSFCHPLTLSSSHSQHRRHIVICSLNHPLILSQSSSHPLSMIISSSLTHPFILLLSSSHILTNPLPTARPDPDRVPGGLSQQLRHPAEVTAFTVPHWRRNTS